MITSSAFYLFSNPQLHYFAVVDTLTLFRRRHAVLIPSECIRTQTFRSAKSRLLSSRFVLLACDRVIRSCLLASMTATTGGRGHYHHTEPRAPVAVRQAAPAGHPYCSCVSVGTLPSACSHSAPTDQLWPGPAADDFLSAALGVARPPVSTGVWTVDVSTAVHRPRECPIVHGEGGLTISTGR